ncbi:thioredoxin domain-containing protein [Streptomyces spectabilis]|uniref:Disulfide bond formation protein D n=1 Tax=Streptomyces spectabilis TaxID=68270 RepID=A0A516R9D5_STRST|nr:thioredoxin domain-containing protein [Streptomyces spectabilis]QDQ12265.1 disulfide bond formation protein D [Streptomyces spectabilis]
MAVRKAGRVAASVAAVALLGAVVTGCDSDDDGDGDWMGGGKKSPSASAEPSDPAGKSPSQDAGPAAKVPPASVNDLAKVPTKVKGGVITVGEPSAKHTVKVYEDPRCPFCKKFEENGAQALVGPLAAGDVKVEYTIASFLDNNFGGDGSKNAANALRAAVDTGKFPQFHSALFANQPEESDDGFTPAFLLKIGTAAGIKDAAFEKAVTSGAHKAWVATAMKSFTADGVSGTPTVEIDGEKAPADSLYDEADFGKALKDAGIS